MARLKTEMLDIKDIYVYENNPRRNEKAVRAVAESIRKFGYTNPILVNADNVILAGHTRLAALKQLGQKQVEVIRLTHLTEEEEKAFRIVDNKVAEFSKWNSDLLQAEMREISADDWKLFGFNEKQINKLKPADMCTCPRCGAAFPKI